MGQTNLEISPNPQTFQEKINLSFDGQRHVSVGLDVDTSEFPKEILEAYPDTAEQVFAFNQSVIEQTHEVAGAFKINPKFYDFLGPAGMEAFGETIAFLQNPEYSHIPIIIDAKVAEVGHTAEMAAVNYFDRLGADAVSVIPYSGGDIITIFTQRPDKGALVMVIMSNPDSLEFLTGVDQLTGQTPYQAVTQQIVEVLNVNDNCMIVVSSKHPTETGQVRQITQQTVPEFVAGIGPQRGNLKTTLSDELATPSVLVGSSRGIIYSAKGPQAAAATLNRSILKHLPR